MVAVFFAEREHNAGNQHGDFNRELPASGICPRPRSFGYFLPRKGASHLVAHQRIEKKEGLHQQHIAVTIPSDNLPLEKKKIIPV